MPVEHSFRAQFTRIFFGLLMASAASLFAQVPDNFTNLQVLRKDIGKGELLEYMKGFTRALGVRCQHCHLGEEGKPLDTFDFVSDEKATKRTARVMLQMVQAINDDHLKKVADRSVPLLTVNCLTCHHGQNRPRMLKEVLSEVIASQGLEAGIAKYRELREKYYGNFVFDFSEGTLIRLAQQLQSEKSPEAALALLELNAEFAPNSWMNYFQMAELHLVQENKKAALENFKKSLELNPQNPIAKRKVEKLMNEQY